MKAHLLLTVATVASYGSLMAQPDPGERSAPTLPARSEPDPVPDGDGNVILPPGSLSFIVDYIERKLMPYWRDHIGTMPNILLADDAAECEVPGPMTLHRVSPLQAVALAVAAADCKMEPIFGPLEAAPDAAKAPSIIGYRVTRSKTPAAGSGNVSLTPGESAGAGVPRLQLQENPMQPVVRVYALGALMAAEGSKAGEAGRIEEEKNLIDLLHSALDKAQPGAPPPELSIHQASRALIVKGTVTQQEIAELVIKVLKENREAETRSPTASKR